jgi:single-strand DNA-binding protein
MFNKIIIAGRLVKEPFIHYTPSGKEVANLRVAVNNKYGNREETVFINAVVFGKAAEATAKNLTKGSPVLVEGRLRERRFIDKQGMNRTTFEIIANRIKFLPKGGNGKASLEETELEPF